MKKIIYIMLLLVSAFYGQAQNNVTQIEYFVDADLGVGLNSIINVAFPDSDITQTINVPAPMSAGFHKLYLRTRDTNGNWSHTARRNIQVVLPDDSLYVVEVEYFFGDDLEFGNCSSVAFANPQTDGSWTFNVPYLQGNYSFNDTLFLRVRDSLNLHWSHTTRLDSIDSIPNGFNQLEADSYYSIFPNPVLSTLNIKFKKQMEYSYSIIDLIGQTYLNGKGNHQSQQINVGNLPQGVYILNIQTKDGSAVKKFVRQ